MVPKSESHPESLTPHGTRDVLTRPVTEGKSKRIPLKQKHKVEKKIRGHNKKQRREAKKNPQSTKSTAATL